MADYPKTALITGCSSGIGLATAMLLAKDAGERFKVYATIRDLNEAEILKNAAGDALNTTLFIKQLDVTSNEQIESVVDEIIAIENKIDILVNNAGTGLFGPLETQSMDKIKDLFATNVYGSINLTKKLTKSWKETKSGHLIMISSVDGLVGVPLHSSYCASKFAIEGFAESIALEGKKFGLKVSIIEPGPVLSGFNEKSMDNYSNLNANHNTDKLTNDMVDVFVEKSRSRFATMGQRPEEIAAYVLQAIESPRPQLRYQPNKLYSTAIGQKLTDSLHQNTPEALQTCP